MKRFLLILGLVLGLLVVGYVAGPRAALPKTAPAPTATAPALTTNLAQLDAEVARHEAGFRLKPDNQARIVWADSARKQKTPYSIVYIPGFSATWAEGEPVHRDIAKRFGCNLYLARTAEHGLAAPDAMKTLSPSAYLESAEQALAIGRLLGEQVIVIGTSMGGALTLYLAAKHPDIKAIVLYSPCVAVANPALKLVTKPWGQQILDQTYADQLVHNKKETSERSAYWYEQYHTNGLLVLQTVLDEHMTAETFARVKQPVFLGYYYKDDEHQDPTVSVPALLTMYDELGTPADKKRKQAFPDAGAHVIASKLTTKDWPAVETASIKFLEDVVGLK
jgi:pimeloyl-ACP methyl ester carboxylesterase